MHPVIVPYELAALVAAKSIYSLCFVLSCRLETAHHGLIIFISPHVNRIVPIVSNQIDSKGTVTSRTHVMT